ncbi:MAG: short-chain dehydrogenase [Deltaproteobacteria bacterium]|nr:short-chain dehydrogenase [Deltaproteobacteria bacterium]
MAKYEKGKPQQNGRRRALVTGASSGIGMAFAERLARDAYEVVIVARRRDRLNALARRLRRAHGAVVEPLVVDLGDPAELRVVEKAVAQDDALELLVNNAAFGTSGPFAELDIDREEAEIRVNVLAPVRLTRAALPGMIGRGKGGIINVSSLGAFQPMPFTATYGATKAYLNSFTEALYEELRDTGVRVQALSPGFTRTDFQKHAGMDTSPLPDFTLMTPEAVVEESLTALESGTLVCVPGLYYRSLLAATSVLPRSLLRRLTASLAKQLT